MTTVRLRPALVAAAALVALLFLGSGNGPARAGPSEQTILVTGYMKFSGGATNVTQDVANKLDNDTIVVGGKTYRIQGEVMDVIWGEPGAKLPGFIAAHKPVIILSLGQCAGDKIRIETIARNFVRNDLTDNNNQTPVQAGRASLGVKDLPLETPDGSAVNTISVEVTNIVPGAKETYPTTLPAEKIVQDLGAANARTSTTAGYYLCEEAFYTVMHLTLSKMGASSGCAGFAHLPGYANDTFNAGHRDTMADRVQTVLRTTIEEKLPCGPDFGDADPKHPTKRADNGARHEDTLKEWLGQPGRPRRESVSGEIDADDPFDMDGTPNLRDDGYDLDRFDDGVRLFPLTYRPGERGKAEFTVCVQQPGARYDPADPDKTLYVNAWIDWNTNFSWEEANSEHIIDGLKLAPKDGTSWAPLGLRAGNTTVTQILTGVGGTCAGYQAEFDVGAAIGTDKLWARFRADYGEDAGRNDPRPLFTSDDTLRDPALAQNQPQPPGQGKGYAHGAARFGEVEDYLIGSDFGDAPDPYTGPNQYPTRKDPAGGRHLDFSREWLGPPGLYASATRETDGCDEKLSEEDRQEDGSPLPNLGAACDGADADKKDDGATIPPEVHPGEEITVEIDVAARVDSLGYANRGPAGQDSKDVETLKPDCTKKKIGDRPDTPAQHRDRGRYAAWDAKRRLYLNVWADWNADGVWSAGELVISGPLDPEDWGGDGKYTLGEPFTDGDGNGVRTPGEAFEDVAGTPKRHLTCRVKVPADVAVGKVYYWRFRLDHGENATTNNDVVHHADEHGRALAGPRGGALWGEVEDYPQSVPEEDEFPNSLGVVMVTHPLGTETIELSGPTRVEVDLAALGDRDGDGREEVPTELVELDLKGSSPLLGGVSVRLRPPGAHPFRRSLGEIEELVNNTPGVLDLPPFTEEGGARSFFDVFFEVELTSPPPIVPPDLRMLHNGEPKHMEGTIGYKPPEPGDSYENLDVIALLTPSDNPSGVTLGSAEHTPRLPLQGDEDCDGDKDAVDALQTLRSLVGLWVRQMGPCPEIGSEVEIDGMLRLWGDVDCNGEVTAVDALKNLRHVAGLPVDPVAGCPAIEARIQIGPQMMPTHLLCIGPSETVFPPGTMIGAVLTDAGGGPLAGRQIQWSDGPGLSSVFPPSSMTDGSGAAQTNYPVPSDAGVEGDETVTAVFPGDAGHAGSFCQVTFHVVSPGLPTPTPTPSPTPTPVDGHTPTPSPTATPCPLDSDCDSVPDSIELLFVSNPNDPNSTPENRLFDIQFGQNSCADFVDNDGNGLTDAQDPKCLDIQT